MTENTIVQWQARSEDAVHPLDPSVIPATLDGPPAIVPPQFTIEPASAGGETITE